MGLEGVGLSGKGRTVAPALTVTCFRHRQLDTVQAEPETRAEVFASQAGVQMKVGNSEKVVIIAFGAHS